jgi:hypothetical protein
MLFNKKYTVEYKEFSKRSLVHKSSHNPILEWTIPYNILWKNVYKRIFLQIVLLKAYLKVLGKSNLFSFITQSASWLTLPKSFL